MCMPGFPTRFFTSCRRMRSISPFACIRRSQAQQGSEGAASPQSPATASIILGDTMGELRTFYSLATIVLVGRSLVDLGHRQHGSDMIEPAALARPTLVGPFTHNFADAMAQFRAADAIVEVTTPDDLYRAVDRLLSDEAARADLGRRAQQVVRTQQGATARHVDAILDYLPALQAVSN